MIYAKIDFCLIVSETLCGDVKKHLRFCYKAGLFTESFADFYLYRRDALIDA